MFDNISMLLLIRYLVQRRASLEPFDLQIRHGMPCLKAVLSAIGVVQHHCHGYARGQGSQPGDRDAVVAALPDCQAYDVRFDAMGTTIIYSD